MLVEKAKVDLKKKLTDEIITYAPKIVEDKNVLKEVHKHLTDRYNIKKTYYYFSDPERLNEAENEELALIAEQIAIKLNVEELKLEKWFNKMEIKELRQFYIEDENDVIKLPLTFENVIKSKKSNNVFMVSLDYSTIARMRKHGLLYYNSEIQREPKLKKFGNTVISVPKIDSNKVSEIEELVLKGDLEETTIAFNCAVETTEDESEQELIYNEKEMTLTITKGTRIDILDGAHRTDGIYQAYHKEKNIQGSMWVQFTNYTTKKAKKYQAEIAKQTPISQERRDALKDTYCSELVGRLKEEGRLKRKIAESVRVNRDLGQLTTFSILLTAFENYWKPEKRRDISIITERFNEYLDVLFDDFEDRIKDENNLLFHKMFFIGHVILAKRMYEENISYVKLYDILKNIDFNKNNQIWEKSSIISKGSVLDNKRTINNIEKFFKNINIKL